MPSFPIIDSHLHIWRPDLLDMSWLKSAGKLNRGFTLQDFDEARADVEVEAMVFVECDVDETATLAEARWVADVAQQDHRIRAIVAHAPIHKGDAVRSHLEKLRDIVLVRGVRRLLQQEADADFALRPDFIDGLKALSEFGWSFDICITYRQMESTIKLVRRFPEMRFVLDHIGKPGIREQRFRPWADQMKELARSGNVVCKLSGVATEADHEHWTVRDIEPFMTTALEAFGPKRLMFAGDWPVATNAVSYVGWVHAVDQVMSKLGGSELRALYRDNAIETYKLNV
ncbi:MULTISPECIES: amidohydrolase family protein [Mesorhizobium]|uniref:L-fuconolactonase n=1 Tax=Rhizobium loti TaxID=381 RepID=A0A8E2WG32_RHILI|nr:MULTISPECIES: amidohydrolase family protein [Mesorhizobium]PWJ93783.1 L-fuconolactonase [Mesorhizobium loti]QKC82155.1 amidohydrolase [Mesorhizobium sp. NZP2077]QKD15627.1 amidohydrolase family protein [Mesorhizobium sp. NZP2077]